MGICLSLTAVTEKEVRRFEFEYSLPPADFLQCAEEANEADEADEADGTEEAEEPIEIIDMLQNFVFWGRVFEITHTQPAEIVFEVQVKDAEGNGVLVYRAERLPSLYP